MEDSHALLAIRAVWTDRVVDLYHAGLQYFAGGLVCR